VHFCTSAVDALDVMEARHGVSPDVGSEIMLNLRHCKFVAILLTYAHNQYF
jgi:hypothetical protein